MCGIGGVVGGPVDGMPAILEQMTAALRHRGPDDSGVHVDSEHAVGICATRLAIRDVTPRGHQPMSGPSGAVIAFNGELYNAGELRAELEARGRRFNGDSDTEIALAAYEELGADSWSRLRGMFAFAIWDPRTRSVWLVRDPLGIKPLYYAWSGGALTFASEVRSLLGAAEGSSLCTAALDSFLATGAVSEPLTIFAGVQMLAPGTAMRLRDGTLDEMAYWSIDDCFAHSEPMTRADAAERLRHELTLAVDRQLVSDVPIGVFLSGGIDSSALVGLAASAHAGLSTVSIVFAEEEFSEAQYIRAVSSRYGTDHHEVELSGDDFRLRLPAALAAMDQPTFDGVNTFVVSQAAIEAGLTVALSGLGGDELFAGYELFQSVPKLETQRDRMPRIPRPAAKLAARVAFGPGDRGRKAAEWLTQDVGSAYELQRELFGPRMRSRLLGGAPSPARRDTAVARSVNDISRLELSRYMRNVLLRDADVMSMANSLEVRVPMLDQDVVELVGRIPSELKLSPGRPKPLLVDAVADLFPREVMSRPKMGFTLPFESWLRGAMRDEVASLLLEPGRGGAIGAALDPTAVAGVWHDFERGATSWSRPWALYVAKLFGERHMAHHPAMQRAA